MKPNKLILAALIFSLQLALFPLIHSADATSLSPLTFELVANPGETVKSVVRVTNTESNTVGISMQVENFTAVGEEGQVALEEGESNNSYSLANWVTVSPQTFTLEPGEVKPVEFTVNVPLDAEPGGHYASILASVSASAPTGGGVGVSQKIGALLLMDVAGDVHEQLHIASFTAPKYTEYGPVTITSRFGNDGTVHVKPRGFILIKNMFGKEVAKIDLPQRNVLPQSIRRVDVDWGNRYMFGRYEATLTAIYGSTNQPLSAVTTFWIFPWKIVAGILLALIVILTLLIRGRKRIRIALRVLFRGSHTHSEFPQR